jgi:hypothetical protein
VAVKLVSIKKIRGTIDAFDDVPEIIDNILSGDEDAEREIGTLHLDDGVPSGARVGDTVVLKVKGVVKSLELLDGGRTQMRMRVLDVQKSK